MADVRLPDITPPKARPEQVEEEEVSYTEAEKAKLANIINAFSKTDNKEERAKAQNEKMKMIGENMMGP